MVSAEISRNNIDGTPILELAKVKILYVGQKKINRNDADIKQSILFNDC